MRYLSRLLLLCIGFLLPAFSYATFIPNPNGINIYRGVNNPVIGNVYFSDGSTPWVSPVAPAIVDSNFIFHGNVWIDAIGWLSFDHWILGSEVKLDKTCLQSSTTTCPITGYLWSKNAGWVVFGMLWDGWVKDAAYNKATWKMTWYAWNTQIGWISLDGVSLWPTVTGFSGLPFSWGIDDSYVTTTTGSMSFSLNIPDDIMNLGTIPTLQICPKNFPEYCYTYLYNVSSKAFLGVDFSIATDYDYTLNDPFGSKTIWVFHVYSNIASADTSVASSTQNLLQRLCIDHPTNTILCPDGAWLKTTWMGGDIALNSSPSGKRADFIESHIGEIHPRDIYGNPIFSIAGIKNISYTAIVDSTLDYNSISTWALYYGANDSPLNQNWGAAYGFFEWGMEDTTTLTSLSSPRTYSWPDDAFGVSSFAIKSYAPTTEGNANILDNNIRISSLFVNVTGIWSGTVDITRKSFTGNLIFKPLIEVTNLVWFENIQMGRPTIFTGTISKNDPNGLSTSPHVIHALSIADNSISTFQNLNAIIPQSECISTTSSNGEAGYDGYCVRSSIDPGKKASVIAFPFDNPQQAFIATPRRLSSVDMIQNYIYDTVITYKLGGHDIVYPSLAIETNWSGVSISWWGGGGSGVVANMVKVIWQANGDTIFQTLTTMAQPKIASLSRADIINQTRKNVTVLSRNVKTFPYVASDYVIYKANGTPVIFDQTLLSDPNNKKSIIVYGDVIVDQNFIDTTSSPRVIIALKDDAGGGWNIYIKNNVQRIDASLVAEGSLISGDPTLYYVDQNDAWALLVKQLYVYGTIISQNTIGGASVPGQPVCPTLSLLCNDQIATHYDLEHMRYYRDTVADAPISPLPRSAAQLSDHDKKASFIIEYNPSILQDPPPWLRVVQ